MRDHIRVTELRESLGKIQARTPVWLCCDSSTFIFSHWSNEGAMVQTYPCAALSTGVIEAALWRIQLQRSVVMESGVSGTFAVWPAQAIVISFASPGFRSEE